MRGNLSRILERLNRIDCIQGPECLLTTTSTTTTATTTTTTTTTTITITTTATTMTTGHDVFSGRVFSALFCRDYAQRNADDH